MSNDGRRRSTGTALFGQTQTPETIDRIDRRELKTFERHKKDASRNPQQCLRARTQI